MANPPEVKLGNKVRMIMNEFEEMVKQLQAENKKLRKFAEIWFGHEENCDFLDDGSPRCDCTCGYEKAREQVLKGGAE